MSLPACHSVSYEFKESFKNQTAEINLEFTKAAGRSIAFRLEATLKPHNPSPAYYECPA